MSEPATRHDFSDAERRLRGLIRESPFPLFLVWVATGEVLEVSAPMESWSGRSRDALIGMQMFENISDPATARRSLALLAAGVIDAYTRRATYTHADGSQLDFEVRITAFAEERPRRTAIGLVLPSGRAPAADLEPAPFSGAVTVVGT